MNPLDDLVLVDQAAPVESRRWPAPVSARDLGSLDAAHVARAAGLVRLLAVRTRPDDVPLITRASPPRPPLAVRRATPEVPRLRAEPPRTPTLDWRLDLDSRPTPRRQPMPRRALRRRRRRRPARPPRIASRGGRRSGARLAAVAIDLVHPRRHRRRRRVLHDADLRAHASRTSACCRRGRCWRSCSSRTAATWWRSRPAGQTLGKMAAGIKVVSAVPGATARSRARAAARRCSGSCSRSRPASAS